MFEELIEALGEDADVHESRAKEHRKEAAQASKAADRAQRRADEKRLAIQVLRCAKVDYGTELIDRGNAPDPE